MLALIMKSFPSMTPQYLLWECDIAQLFMWSDRAIEMETGKMVERRTSEQLADKINNQFVYDETTGRWR